MPGDCDDARVATVHRYAVRVAWRGSTAAGYDAYAREHDVTVLDADGGPVAPGGTPQGATLRASADPAFGGHGGHPNPEQLLLAAAASCQLLSFLAVAARARLDVVAYEDDATAEMDEGDPPLRLTAIALSPRVTLAPGGRDVTDERLAKLLETAHRECFVARSLATPVTLRSRTARPG